MAKDGGSSAGNPAEDSAWSGQVDIYLENCLRRESPARVKELARFLEMSRSSLHRRFTEILGTTPSCYLRQAEVRAASQLLRGSTLKETRVAYKAGFGTRRTLFRNFQKTQHMTPSEYRELAHPDSEGPNVTTSPIPKGARTEVSGLSEQSRNAEGKSTRAAVSTHRPKGKDARTGEGKTNE